MTIESCIVPEKVCPKCGKQGTVMTTRKEYVVLSDRATYPYTCDDYDGVGKLLRTEYMYYIECICGREWLRMEVKEND
jgi:hypothetical protein